MNQTIVFRLITPSLFSRIEVNKTAKLSDIKYEIQRVTKIPIASQKLYYDQRFTRQIRGSDSSSIASIRLSHGDTIYLSNASTQPDKAAEPEKKCNHTENETCLNCVDKKTKKEEKKELTVQEKQRIKDHLTEKCTHLPGQQCLHCMQTPNYKGELKYKCQHGEGGKCPNCVGKEFIADAKHKSFDQFVNERKEKCKGTHENTTYCINCMPPATLNYKMKPNCPNHQPYPLGCCNKCMPPNVILNRQVYRHVDYISFMNSAELKMFINPWIEGNYQHPRMAYLFGYYAKDPNYPDGIRAIVELLYEPPQIGDIGTSAEPIIDENIPVIDLLTKELSLECIGWIFTSLNEPGICLNCKDIKKAARYQEEYPMDHPSGIKISRFVTCVVRPNDMGECSIEAYMVSDMCQALQRDNLFDNSDNQKKMKIRKAKPNEMLPTIYMENNPCVEFDPDFFIVNIGNGVPTNIKDTNILKTYDFPVSFRAPKGIVTQRMVKDYFKNHRSDKMSVKCANFYFLLYIAKQLDIETASTWAKQIVDGTLDESICDEMVSLLVGAI